jgi:hypothetical protein
VLKIYASSELPQAEPEVVRKRIAGLFMRSDVAEMFGPSRSPLRQRILSVEVMVLCMLDFVLLRMQSMAEVVRRLQEGKIEGFDAVDVSSQAFYKRLRAIPHQLYLQMLQGTSQLLKQRQATTRRALSALGSYAGGVYAVDDTTLDALVRRTKVLKQKPKGDLATLGGRLACAIDLLTGKFEQVVYDSDAAANEKSHVRSVIEPLPAQAMLVFDLGYFSFALFDWITETNRYFVTRLRNKATYETLCVLADRAHYRDRIVWLGKYRADRAANPVRLVELQINGRWWSYVTNVLQPSRLSAEQLWGLYSQRWTIEMCFAAVKRSLGLSYLRSTVQNAMLTQVWATLTVYQVLQDMRLEVAHAHGWDEDDVSWEMLMRRIGWYAESRPQKPLGDWLCEHVRPDHLKKTGTRKRRSTELPTQVLEELKQAGPDPMPSDLRVRKARHGDCYPLKDPALLVHAKLGATASR